MSANERSGGTSTAWVDASHVSTSSVVNVRGYVDNRPKDARDVERAKGVYVPPSVDEARAHGDATQPRQLNERGQLTGFSMLDQNLDLGVEFSPGVQGYFLVVKALALLFLALFALILAWALRATSRQEKAEALGAVSAGLADTQQAFKEKLESIDLSLDDATTTTSPEVAQTAKPAGGKPDGSA